MSDIVIRGIEMPKDKQYSLTIFPNGRVIQHWDGVVFGETEAIKLPSYGRLIDADKLRSRVESAFKNKVGGITYELFFEYLMNIIDDAPTVLEANKE